LYTIPSKLTICADYEHQWVNRNSTCLFHTRDTITTLLAVGPAPCLLRPYFSDPESVTGHASDDQRLGSPEDTVSVTKLFIVRS